MASSAMDAVISFTPRMLQAPKRDLPTALEAAAGGGGTGTRSSSTNTVSMKQNIYHLWKPNSASTKWA